jgi:splicing factor, arginine/serine-rich 1
VLFKGNLPPDVRTKDIEDLFYKYGKIRYIDLKNRKGPPFAFIEFEDSRDAEDAIECRDRYNFDGYKIRVEFQKGPRDNSNFRRGGGGSNGNFSGPPTRRSDNRCTITGLPPSGSWQDIKDHMREAGNVCFADVFKDGTGVVEFTRYEDMKYAIKHLDDSKFRSHEVIIHFQYSILEISNKIFNLLYKNQ